jgi:hypothetical protein
VTNPTSASAWASDGPEVERIQDGAGFLGEGHHQRGGRHVEHDGAAAPQVVDARAREDPARHAQAQEHDDRPDEENQPCAVLAHRAGEEQAQEAKISDGDVGDADQRLLELCRVARAGGGIPSTQLREHSSSPGDLARTAR